MQPQQITTSSIPLHERLSQAEKALAESQALLSKVLPDFVIERLKARPEEPIADHFEDASVLFADIEGFVAIARKLGGKRTVALLNRLTRAFDRLADRYEVEKIKTIGDGYMAVAGVTRRQEDHCQRLARLALDMLEAAGRIGAQWGIGLRLRIGIAAGPVTAGVIGVNKFAFDVWGDAVNRASRLEHLAGSGRILVSSDVRDLLGDAFCFTPRGTVEIRGLGTDSAWMLEGPAPDPVRLH